MTTLWQLAKSIETEGKKMYEELGRNALESEIAGVFFTLAKEEQRHCELFENLEKHKPIDPDTQESVSIDVPELFQKIRAELLNDEVVLAAMNDAETTYRQALILENSSIDLFTKIRKKLTDEYKKEIVSIIIAEEKRHVALIKELITLVHRPKEWLENAEVFHSDEY